MVWLGACAKALTTAIIFENETINADVYINEVLPIALQCGDKMLESNWNYQQNGATPHIHHLTEGNSVPNIFLFSFPRSVGPPSSPDLCPLD